jgi:L-fuconolactonase
MTEKKFFLSGDFGNVKGIDSHQHFWHYNAVKHDWIDDEMAIIRKDFLPEDLQPILKENNIEGCVAVQADQTEEETNFLIALAQTNNFIKGVVGWVDLRAENVQSRLAHYHQYPIVKGFRHILQGEEPEFMLSKEFKNGIAALQEFNFNYDLLLFPKHLKAAKTLVEEFPNQRFVIDHISKPLIKSGEIEEWKKDIATIAKNQNVSCKISGMVTEADYHNWKKEDFAPYLDVIIENFGINRILFGSDWPVCLVAASYKKMQEIVGDYFSTYSEKEQELFFRTNTVNFYQL